MLPVVLVHLWCIPNKLVLKKDIDIIHVAMGGGVKKVFTLVKGGSKSFGGLRRGGGQKSLTTKIFNCPASPTKVFMNTPLLHSLIFDFPSGLCVNYFDIHSGHLSTFEPTVY